MNKIALITVVYNNYEILKDFFASLEKQNPENYHLFVADLSDQKQDIKTKIPMTVIQSKNLGYAHGVNLGLKTAISYNFDKFCVINNDVYFEKEFVKAILKSTLGHPGSLISGKIYYAPGYEYHKDHYSNSELGKVIWYAGGHVDWKHAQAVHRGVDQMDKKDYNKFEETDFISGCLAIFDKKVLDKVGFWDEKYFLYYEDVDFSQRAKRAGINLYYDPSLVLWHKNSQSTGGSGSGIHQKYLKRNQLRFGLKYAPFRTKLHLIKNRLFGSK